MQIFSGEYFDTGPCEKKKKKILTHSFDENNTFVMGIAYIRMMNIYVRFLTFEVF